MSIPIPDRIRRYHAWLKREQVERPLIGLIWEPDIPPHPDLTGGSMQDQKDKGERTDQEDERDKEVTPEHIKPAAVLPHIEKWHHRDAELTCDVIHCFCPAFGIPWMEAIAGCKVVSYPGSLWAEPCLSSYRDKVALQFNPDNPWLSKLVEFTRILVGHSDGRFPVALPQMRGPLDILAAMRSPEQMCIDILQQPEDVFRILDELTNLWTEVNKCVLNEIPSFYGGYISRMKAWMPGRTITPQNDVSGLISPSSYRQFAEGYDRKIMSAFPYHCFHLHATEYKHIPTFLNLERLTALQVTLEHTLGGPALEIMMPLLHNILKEKPLLVCTLDRETADICINELPAAGLAVTIGLQGDDFGRENDEWLLKWCG